MWFEVVMQLVRAEAISALVRELALQGANGSYTDAQRRAIAVELLRTVGIAVTVAGDGADMLDGGTRGNEADVHVSTLQSSDGRAVAVERHIDGFKLGQ